MRKRYPRAYERLRPAVVGELIDYLIEGNDPRELADSLLKAMSERSMKLLVDEVIAAHEQCGDYPFTDHHMRERK